MKTEFLKSLGLEQEAIDKIMLENGKDIEKHKQSAEAISSERDGLKEQLAAANTAIEEMKGKAADAEAISAAAAKWEEKYKTDTAALVVELEQTKYAHGIEALVNAEKFSSTAAKKAFIADLTAKGLPLEDGKLIGYDDFKKTYAESDPGAFAVEGTTPPPYAAGTGTGNMFGKKSIKEMTYAEEAQFKVDNPGLYKEMIKESKNT